MKCKKSFLSTILVLAVILGFGLSSALAVNGVDFVQVNGRVVGLFQGGVGVSPTATSDPNMTLYSGSDCNYCARRQQLQSDVLYLCG